MYLQDAAGSRPVKRRRSVPAPPTRSLRRVPHTAVMPANQSVDGWLLVGDHQDEPDNEDQPTSPGVQLSKNVQELEQSLSDLDKLWQHRRQPLLDQLDDAYAALADWENSAASHLSGAAKDPANLAPGPLWLRWVDSFCFGVVCSLIVVLNLLEMGLSDKYQDRRSWFVNVENLFLIWYILELTLRTIYHQQFLFCGGIASVWYNWMDLFIVVCGILDQWIVPVCYDGDDRKVGGLRALRFLRLARILRVTKLLHVSCGDNLEWVEGEEFHFFMTVIIGVNAAAMGVELDHPWTGWIAVESVFLGIYSLEVMLRLRLHGLRFFIDPERMAWNIFDFMIVAGGIADMWMIPLIGIADSIITGERSVLDTEDVGSFMQLVRLLRLLRVLRLMRLIREHKALHRLMSGVLGSLKAIQWVLALTLLVLYAAAIIFTELFGKGMLFGSIENTPPDVIEAFATVSVSYLSLFKMMDGDTSYAKSLCKRPEGTLFFVVFMVLFNWIILAILTSVISDHMISASAKAILEEQEAENKARDEIVARRLHDVFREIDKDGSGELDEMEWQELLNDEALATEICEASGLPKNHLDQLFNCLAVESADEDGCKVLKYGAFIDHMQGSDYSADRRSIMHVIAYLRRIESALYKAAGDNIRSSRRQSSRVRTRVNL